MYIEGTTGPNTLDGTDHDDIIDGREGNDSLKGFGGNDRLDGGLGADQMIGGTGDDLYTVDDDGDTVVEYSGEGTDEVRSLVWLYTLPDHVENLTGTDARGQGLYGNSAGNILTGYVGNDGLSIRRAATTASTAARAMTGFPSIATTLMRRAMSFSTAATATTSSPSRTMSTTPPSRCSAATARIISAASAALRS